MVRAGKLIDFLRSDQRIKSIIMHNACCAARRGFWAIRFQGKHLIGKALYMMEQ